MFREQQQITSIFQIAMKIFAKYTIYHIRTIYYFEKAYEF